MNSDLKSSKEFLDFSVKFNIFAAIFGIIIGSFGNFLTLYVYSRKKFRVNSFNVYLFCLAANNSFFLILHFLEVIFKIFLILIYYIFNKFLHPIDFSLKMDSNKSIEKKMI